MSQRPPNVLLVLSDEQRFDAVGFNGNPIVHTPNLDGLAAQSMNYARHTCSSPVCTPARSSIFTGLYPRTHGAFNVGWTLDPEIPTLATWLDRAGYACGLFGKSHLEPELSGHTERLARDTPYYGFARTGLSEDNLIGPYMDWIRREHPQWEAAAWTQANEACQPGLKLDDPARLAEVFPSPLPFELSQSAWITRQTQEFIREQQAAGKPFFAVCSYVPPHHPWTPPEPFASMYDPAEMPLSERLPAGYQPAELLHGYNYKPGLPDSELQRSISFYYALCTMVDECIGRVLSTLRECGADENTIVIFTSDHGDYNGTGGLIRKCGPAWDSLLRVPMLVRASGRAPGRCETLSQHEDLAPTILDLLGLPVPPGLPGVRLAKETREFACYEHPFPYSRTAYGASDGNYKLLHYSSGEDLLVQPASDPLELRNLFSDPSARAARERLEHALYRWFLLTPPRRPRTHYPW